jgi:hypothetical protein
MSWRTSILMGPTSGLSSECEPVPAQLQICNRYILKEINHEQNEESPNSGFTWIEFNPETEKNHTH